MSTTGSIDGQYISISGGTVDVTNNLTLNGTATLTNAGILSFLTTTGGTQTLSGSGTVTFSGTSFTPDQITQSVSGGTQTVVIASGITIQGGNGDIGLLTNGPFENWTLQGPIEANSNGQTIAVQFGNFTLQGSASATNNGIVWAATGVTRAPSARPIRRSTWPVTSQRGVWPTSRPVAAR